MDDQILTVSQVASRLNVREAMVYALIRAGRLRAANIGAGAKPYWRITGDALREFLDAPAAGQQQEQKAARPHGPRRRVIPDFVP